MNGYGVNMLIAEAIDGWGRFSNNSATTLLNFTLSTTPPFAISIFPVSRYTCFVEVP
jgi:hypothetical protein